jgi:hypothetical protein
MTRFGLSIVVSVILSGFATANIARADTRGTWSAAHNNPAIILGDAFPVSFYRVCYQKGNAVKIRYVLETDKVRETDLRMEGNCIDLKAKRIEISVPGGEGVFASGTYNHLPAR